MPIPYRDQRDSADTDLLAGFLKFISLENGRTIEGALFLVNGRGEPVDFTYSSVTVGGAFLWRAGEAKRSALVSLVIALFEACPRRPSVLLALAGEVPNQLFGEDILVEIPVCLISEAPRLDAEGKLDPDAPLELVHLFWIGDPPSASSHARTTVERLRERQLLLEPFDRAELGISEARHG